VVFFKLGFAVQDMTPETWQQLKDLFQTALELSEEVRRAYLLDACNGDTELLHRVEKLLSAHSTAGAFLNSPAVVDAGIIGSTEEVIETEVEVCTGRRLGPYEIIRELGHGGMGTVYLAARADDQYRKEVAIKLVKRGMDTDTILRRFMMERQILANLEHPNIARLLEGGATSDGLPYFVMEYIDGRPINRYCDENKFTVVERLELFRHVCSALQYAHQNLVVHRDIKPGNILVTTDGVPKLLDFGIAKLLSPNWANETGDGPASLVGPMTPEYASPEQLRGIAITTASDVYSLGVVLYELLSGCHPYQFISRQPEEVIRVILQVEPEKPSAVLTRKRDVPTSTETEENRNTATAIDQTREENAEKLRRRLSGDLDNIVLKALRKEPQRRYATVQELSEDIRRHLEGLPVIASPDTFAYRAGKFIRRNRVGVIAAAIVGLTLLTASGITTWQARIASSERDKAERRFEQVRKLAKSVLFEYHDGIEKLPGSTPIRQKMVQDALEYLDNLSKESGGDTALQSELASAYERVGDVQGAPYRANLGNYAGALESHKKALAIREILSSTFTLDSSLTLALARSYGAVGELSQVTGNIPGALELYRKEFDTLAPALNDVTDAKRELGVLHVRFGKALAASGELAKAIENHRKGIAITGELALANPNDQSLKRVQAFAHIFLGDALQLSGELKGALEAQRTAFALLQPLVQQANAQSQRDVNVAYARIADVLALLGDKRGALDIDLKALAIDQELAKADPSNALARRDIYIDHYKIAFMQEAVGEIQDALANQRLCVALCEAEVQSNTASSETRGDLGVAYFRLGEMLEKNGDLGGGLHSYKQAISIQEAMSNSDASNKVARGDWSEDLMKAADVAMKLGNQNEALEGYRKSLAIRQELVAANRDDAEGLAQLANISARLGAFFMSLAQNEKRASDWKEAERQYEQSLDVWLDLRNRNKLVADDVAKPDEITKKLAECKSTLSKISVAEVSKSK